MTKNSRPSSGSENKLVPEAVQTIQDKLGKDTKIYDLPWQLSVCNNCRFVCLIQDELRFGSCMRCTHGLLYYVCDVSLTVKETDYIGKDIVADDATITAVMKKE